MNDEGNILAILEKDPQEEIPEETSNEWEYDPVEGERIYNEVRAYRGLEKNFETELCDVLDEHGLLYERQKHVATGVIDIFVYGQPPWIIEVKRAGTPFYLIQAITQLKFYESCFKRKPVLFISVPHPGIDSKYYPIMKQFGVKEFRGVKYEDGKTGWIIYG